MTRLCALSALLVALATSPAADTKPAVKVEDAAPPKELSEAVRGLLDGKSLTVTGDTGKVICVVWPVKSLDSKATPEQAKAGLKYSHVEESTVVGAVKFPADFVDYRKQKIKAGVYTMRLGIQPMDGDHMGTAPYSEFCLLCPADADKKPDLLEPKELHELSSKSTTRKHPGMMLLFPNKTPPESPVVDAKPKEHWVLSYRVPVKSPDKSALGFSLVVIGQTMAE